MKGIVLVASAVMVASCASQSGTPAASAGSAVVTPSATQGSGEFPGAPLIRENDIRGDLFAMAGDAMRGREAGSIDELRASGWVAQRAREAGLEPAGEDGSYFQWFTLHRTRQSVTSRIVVDGQRLALWQDASVLGLSEADIDAPIVWLGAAAAVDSAGESLAGKVAAVLLDGSDAPPPGDALAARRWIGQAPQRAARPLIARGALAVLVVADARADALFDIGATNTLRGRYAIDDGGPARGPGQTANPVILVRNAWAGRISAGSRFGARLTMEQFDYPSVNIVARVRGTDPALRDEYVLFSAHQDHDGVRAAIAGDSIWNGADDNASVAVAVLAIGRAWAQQPGRRSALFVWHGAEEKGLFGSRWYSAHPTVPKESIVAVLNGDMIGRNSPDTAALMGSIPPHRNSTDLVAMALRANDRLTKFAVDSSWDRPEHREGWYFRSDHLPYARLNIPALFYSSNLHPDYHTPRDGPERIDVGKVTRIARWMYATGWLVANNTERPRIDPGFKLER
jgi:Peptidase family M28